MTLTTGRTSFNLGNERGAYPDLLVVGVRPELEQKLQRDLELGRLAVVPDIESTVDQDLPADSEN